MAKRKKRAKKEEVTRIDIEVVVMTILSLLLAAVIYIKSGYIGEQLTPILGGIFGSIKYIIPIGTFTIAIYLAIRDKEALLGKLVQYGIFLCAIAVLFSVYRFSKGSLQMGGEYWDIVKKGYELGEINKGGGAIGTALAIPLLNLVAIPGTIIIAVGAMITSLIIIFQIKPTHILVKWFEEREERKEEAKIRREEERNERLKASRIKVNIPEETEPQIAIKMDDKPKEIKEVKEKIDPDIIHSNLFQKEEAPKEDKTREVLVLDHAQTLQDENYEFPPFSLLENQRSSGKTSKKVVTDTATKLQKTLHSFGVSAKVENVSVGPAITRYELKPAEGVRVSRIANLADDIALNLAVESIRIEAPIPGKQAVGIEISNKEKEMVPIREMLETSDFKESESKLAIALGKDVSGESVIADIAKMPHVLIAGATGAGKSVCINTLVTSILYKAKPSEVRFVMIDPKVVELSVYEGIPHLLIPVVTDAKKAAGALAWAVQEMVNRYGSFAQKGVRDIEGYNRVLEQENTGEQLPQIVIIIDELSDLMMVAKNDVEDAIVRLSQMARAAGMHLVIATQRPSVDVITGIIKANIPSRISFAVTSGVDSRTILDMIGAEKLLGKGDMLFFPVGKSKPTRIQGAYISDKEVEKIVGFLTANGKAKYNEDIMEQIEKADKTEQEQDLDGDDIDEFLDEAIQEVVRQGQASTSFIQRRFKVGYARAGRIIDQMEERGVISGYQGSKPRQVLISQEQLQEWRMKESKTINETDENGKE